MHGLARVMLLVATLAVPVVLPAQDERPAPLPVTASPDTTESLRLFLDCSASGCDFDYLRTELTWVNYVRDRTAAQVHVIATSLGTGSGGRETTLNFIGLREFEGVDDEIRFTTAQGATGDEQRKELTRVLKIGLARYLVRTPHGTNLVLNYVAPKTAVQTEPPHDPWNSWVFSVGFGASSDGESEAKSHSLNGNLAGSRTTEQWKSNFSFGGYNNHSEYNLGDGNIYNADSHSYSGSGLLVRSLGSHTSLGATLSGANSTQSNIDLRVRVAPTFEYDFFKYADYTRRRLILSYSLGINRYDYTDTTIYNKTRETLMDQAVSLSYSARAPWGSTSVGLAGSSYLDDAHKYRASIYGSMSLRVTKGLQLSYSASYARVHDQITLPKQGASNEEILLRLRQLRTSYQYYGYLSLNYTFGSVFNNVVNPRLGNSGGGSEMFF